MNYCELSPSTSLAKNPKARLHFELKVLNIPQSVLYHHPARKTFPDSIINVWLFVFTVSCNCSIDKFIVVVGVSNTA